MPDDSFLKRPFNLGSCQLPSNIFCAPLAGCSDLPFRKMTKKYQPGLVYTEMVKMDALVRHDPSTYRLLDYSTDMHPIGAQLCGSKLQYAATAAKIIEDLGFDVLDLNCGCPVDKVTKDGSGSAMLKTPELIGDIIHAMSQAVKIPVTVKIRAGWDAESINASEITPIAEQAGAKAICIHGRTRAQGYEGPANWDYIKACKVVAKQILVIANGDVFDAPSASAIFKATGCDAILLARGTMGQPWLIEDIYRHLSNESPIYRTVDHTRQDLLEHIAHIFTYQSEKRAVLDLRRVGCWYLKKIANVKKLREALNRAQSIDDVLSLMNEFNWENVVV